MPAFKSINVAIVDDHNLYRKTLVSYLSGQENINIAAQASRIEEILSDLRQSDVDVLIIDIFTTGSEGKKVLAKMRTEFPPIKVLIFSMFHDVNVISDYLDSGIYGYISKVDEPEDLVQGILAVSENQVYQNKWFTKMLYWNTQQRMQEYPDRGKVILNQREQRLLQLLWEEKSNKEIADELFLGIRSIEKMRQDIKEKISARSTVGLIKYAINKKIINNGNR